MSESNHEAAKAPKLNAVRADTVTLGSCSLPFAQKVVRTRMLEPKHRSPTFSSIFTYAFDYQLWGLEAYNNNNNSKNK